MRVFVALMLICVFAIQARADIVTSIGISNVFEKEAYPTQYSNRTPVSLRVGYKLNADSLFAEYGRFSADDSNGQVKISRTENLFLLWARHSFWSEEMFQIYVQLAPGAQLETVETNFMTQTQQDTSKPYFALAAAAGGALEIDRFRFEIELRALNSAIATPNPTLSVGFYGGYLF